MSQLFKSEVSHGVGYVVQLFYYSLGRVQVVCMRDIFILNEIWAQHKIYVSVGTLLG
jgi:hypothetical protein